MADDCHLNCINKLPFLVVVFIGNPTYSVLREERESVKVRERELHRQLCQGLGQMNGKCRVVMLTPQESHHNPKASTQDLAWIAMLEILL